MSKSSLPFEYHPQEEHGKVKTPSKCTCPPLEEPTKVKKKEKGLSLYLDGKKRNGLDDIELDLDIKTPTSAKSNEDQNIEVPEPSANEISIQCDLPTTPKESVLKHDIEVVIEPRIEMKQMDAGLRYSNIYSSENFDACDASLCHSTPSQNTNSDNLDLPNPPISRSPIQFGLRYGYPPTPPPPPTQPPTPQCLHGRGPICYPYTNPAECSTFLPYNHIASPAPCCLPNCTPPTYSSNFPPICQPKYFPPVCSPRRPLTCGSNFASTRALSCPPRARCISPCRAVPTTVPNRCPSPDRYSLTMNAPTPCPLPRSPSPCPQSPTSCLPPVRNLATCQSPCATHGRNISSLSISPNHLPLRCSMPCPPLGSPISYSTLCASKAAPTKFAPPSQSRSPLLSAYSKSKGEPYTLPTHVPCSPGRRSFMKRLLFKKKA